MYTPKASPQPSPTSSSKASPQPSPTRLPVSSSIGNKSYTELNEQNQILLSLVINIISDLILIFFGYFGIKSIKNYIKEYETGKEVGELKSFWSNQKMTFKLRQEKYNIVFLVHLDQSSNNTSNDLRFNYHHAFVIYMIRNILERIYGKDVVKLHPIKQGEQIRRELFNDNIIILGGYQGIKNFELFYEKLNLKKPSGNPVIERNFVQSALGSIVRIVNPNNKLIIIFDGQHELGILGSVKLVTTAMRNYDRNDITINAKNTWTTTNQKNDSYMLTFSVRNDNGKEILTPESVHIRLAEDKEEEIPIILRNEQIQKAINSFSS